MPGSSESLLRSQLPCHTDTHGNPQTIGIRNKRNGKTLALDALTRAQAIRKVISDMLAEQRAITEGQWKRFRIAKRRAMLAQLQNRSGFSIGEVWHG